MRQRPSFGVAWLRWVTISLLPVAGLNCGPDFDFTEPSPQLLATPGFPAGDLLVFHLRHGEVGVPRDGQVELLETTGSVPSVVTAALAYVPERQLVVAFGGSTFPGCSDELWSFDGEEWRLLEHEGPSPRRGARMWVDERDGRLRLQGGYGCTNLAEPLHDEWALDLDRGFELLHENDFYALSRDVGLPGPGPVRRDRMAFAADSETGSMFLYVGRGDRHFWRYRDGRYDSMPVDAGPMSYAGDVASGAFDAERQIFHLVIQPGVDDYSSTPFRFFELDLAAGRWSDSTPVIEALRLRPDFTIEIHPQTRDLIVLVRPPLRHSVERYPVYRLDHELGQLVRFRPDGG